MALAIVGLTCVSQTASSDLRMPSFCIDRELRLCGSPVVLIISSAMHAPTSTFSALVEKAELTLRPGSFHKLCASTSKQRRTFGLHID
jgi:hypothetical protein